MMPSEPSAEERARLAVEVLDNAELVEAITAAIEAAERDTANRIWEDVLKICGDMGAYGVASRIRSRISGG